MRLAEQVTAASHLVLAMSAWSVKTRRAPSRRYRDARVYGHTTKAMHDNEYTPPPEGARNIFIPGVVHAAGAFRGKYLSLIAHAFWGMCIGAVFSFQPNTLALSRNSAHDRSNRYPQ